jgi:ribosomal protein S27AE
MLTGPYECPCVFFYTKIRGTFCIDSNFAISRQRDILSHAMGGYHRTGQVQDRLRFFKISFKGFEKMTDKLKTRARLDRGDGSVIVHIVSDEGEKSGRKPVSGNEPVEPHDRESEVTKAITGEKLICPQCGKLTLHAEFPDHYEAWVKCSECGFFMGMNNRLWHNMENSPNINQKIKKMAIKKELVKV